eukprot:531882-Prorocentrum_minimum.AAC.2
MCVRISITCARGRVRSGGRAQAQESPEGGGSGLAEGARNGEREGPEGYSEGDPSDAPSSSRRHASRPVRSRREAAGHSGPATVRRYHQGCERRLTVNMTRRGHRRVCRRYSSRCAV